MIHFIVKAIENSSKSNNGNGTEKGGRIQGPYLGLAGGFDVKIET
jgi:hypothetical protein